MLLVLLGKLFQNNDLKLLSKLDEILSHRRLMNCMKL